MCKQHSTVLTEKEYSQSFSYMKRRAFLKHLTIPSRISRMRDLTFFILMSESALRVSEACDLEASDVRLDEPAPYIVVRNGKGGKRRKVGVTEFLADALREWQDIRPDAKPYLCTADGTRTQRTHINRVLKRAADKLMLGSRLHPHGLRATCATRMLRAGVSLIDIQAQMGHSTLQTTSVYLQSVGDEHVVNISQSMEAINEMRD